MSALNMIDQNQKYLPIQRYPLDLSYLVSSFMVIQALGAFCDNRFLQIS